jgi:MFS family permease
MTKLDQHYPKPGAAWLAIAVLMLAYTFSFIDRMILSLLVEPIKQDLQISDVQVSLLQGLSFALLYTLAGIPIGRLVDSRRRTSIIAIGMTLWCFMTAACALAQKFWHLFLTRAGVGVGEAALAPAAFSLIGDLFPPRRRGLAMGVFSSGSSIGAGLALIIGGYAIEMISASGERTLPFVGTLEPWRLTFIYVGLPGLIVALMIRFIPEPERKFSSADAGSVSANPSIPFREVLSHYRQHARTITLHHLGIAFAAMGSYGIMAWLPVMLIRTHAWPVGDVGAAVGSSILVAGTFGVIAGGWLGDQLESRGRGAGRLEAAFISMVLAAAGAFMFPMQDTATMIIAWFLVNILGGFMVIGCAAAALLEIMPNRMRGQATAVYYFVVSLLGIGAGPTIVAMFTDYVFGDPAAVRWSLMIAPTAAYILSGAFFWLGRKPYIRSCNADKN